MIAGKKKSNWFKYRIVMKRIKIQMKKVTIIHFTKIVMVIPTAQVILKNGLIQKIRDTKEDSSLIQTRVHGKK